MPRLHRVGLARALTISLIFFLSLAAHSAEPPARRLLDIDQTPVKAYGSTALAFFGDAALIVDGGLRLSHGEPGDASIIHRSEMQANPAPVTLDGKLFYSWGRLWVTDGTTAGTIPLSPRHGAEIVTHAGRVYFPAETYDEGWELWSTDGSREGTGLVKNVALEDSDASPRWLVSMPTGLLFTAQSGNRGREWWRTDGTPAGTELLLDLRPGSGSSIDLARTPKATKALGRVFFAADDGTHGREIWSTDGTATGTALLADLCPGTCSIDAGNLVEFDGAVYFSTRAAGTHALWRSDGTGAGTVKLRELPVGPGAQRPLTLMVAVGRIVLSGRIGNAGEELWAWSGAASDEPVLLDVAPGSAHASPRELTPAGDRLYFVAYTSATRTRLWRTDGTPEGTQMVDEPYASPNGTDPFNLRFRDGDLYYIATGTDEGRAARRLRADGVGFPLVVQAWTTRSSLQVGFNFSAASLGRVLVFHARDTVHGDQLWRSDGTESGTYLLPGPISGVSRSHLARVGDALLYVAGGWGQEALWRTDGTVEGTRILSDFGLYAKPDPADWNLFGPRTMAVMGRHVYFSVDADWGRELWRSDGTVAGTERVLPFYFNERIDDFRTIGGTVIFRHGGTRLWRTDGTEVGTYFIREFGPARESDSAGPVDLARVAGDREGGILEGFRQVGNLLYFQATTPESGTELWKTDGTVDGTLQVADIWPGPQSSGAYPRTELGGRLLFAAAQPGTGGEPWITDGSLAGTRLIDDVMPGRRSSSLTCGQRFEEAAVCVGATADDWGALWRVADDGTGARTIRLFEQIDDSWDRTSISSRLLFAADGGSTGMELWISDGTDEGTRLVQDLWPGPLSSSPRAFAPTDTRVFFSATDEAGTELWVARTAIVLGDPLRGARDLWLETKQVFGDGADPFAATFAAIEGWLSDADPSNDRRAVRRLQDYADRVVGLESPRIPRDVVQDLARFAEQLIELIARGDAPFQSQTGGAVSLERTAPSDAGTRGATRAD